MLPSARQLRDTTLDRVRNEMEGVRLGIYTDSTEAGSSLRKRSFDHMFLAPASWLGCGQSHNAIHSSDWLLIVT
jgi:hypothetical protein